MIWRHSQNPCRVFSKMTQRHSSRELWRGPNNMKASNKTLWKMFRFSYQIKLCRGLCTPSEGLFVEIFSFGLACPCTPHRTNPILPPAACKSLVGAPVRFPSASIFFPSTPTVFHGSSSGEWRHLIDGFVL